MKPHKNEKITHYNVGQPWLAQKEKKPKNPCVEVALNTAHDYVADGWFDTIFGISLGKTKSKAPKYIDLYTATTIKPNQFIVEGQNVEWIEGLEVLISKTQILKNPNLYGMMVMDYSYNYFWHTRTHQETIKYRVEQFLNEPEPESTPSVLILPSEFEAQRKRDLHKGRLTEFIEKEVEYQLAPLQSATDVYREQVNLRDTKIADLLNLIDKLNEGTTLLAAELTVLRGRKAHIESMQITLGERPRQFRED